MKKSTKAVLLSALIFPGVGHFFLKRIISGVVLAGAAVVALYVLVSNVIGKALDIADKIQRGEVQPDIAVITELVSKQSTGDDALLISVATAMLIISWLVAVIDSYRIGRLQERREPLIKS